MQESGKSVDPRTKRTKRAIRNALAGLLAERDLNAITIRDVAARAEINRKTFYNYYGGIHQVLDEIENEVVAMAETVFADLDLKRDMENPYAIFQKITAVINTDMDFYGHLLSMTENAGLSAKLTAHLKEKAREALAPQLKLESGTVNVILDYSLSGLIGVYQNWFNSDRRGSIEEISRTVSDLFFRGFNAFLEEREEPGKP